MPDEKGEKATAIELVEDGQVLFRKDLSRPPEFFRLSELQDEKQIIEEMRGEYVSSFVYRFTAGGKEIVNLSYAGVKEAIRRRGGVDIVDWKIEDVDDEYRVVVKARDRVNMIECLGAATCKKSAPFAWVLAVNKAERNALRKMIPEKLIVILVKEYQKLHAQRLLAAEAKPQ
jgi:hypothetical protein